ncbi:hypothetical protein GQ44DRAFT_612707 [Phaeosphaeriaceae sp. PMI808]|nr:hypothetical protein GQ44DRAFT_612707 [Phaeosphaeriaceae sp. PMI808]
MKLSAIIALFTVTVVLASPAFSSLKRSVREVQAEDGTVTIEACIECECTGFVSVCTCVSAASCD